MSDVAMSSVAMSSVAMSSVAIPCPRFATPRQLRPALECGTLRPQPAQCSFRWRDFVAGLWSRYRLFHFLTSPPKAAQRVALVAALIALPGCSEIAQSRNAAPPGPQPSYVTLAANYLQSTLKDIQSYDGLEISAPRWVDTLKGWTWLTCVRFHDHGHVRIYAIFIADNAVTDARYAVGIDNCEAQSYTQFDLISGVLGQPTAPVQPPLY
jgi:hypothetical protein